MVRSLVNFLFVESIQILEMYLECGSIPENGIISQMITKYSPEKGTHVVG